MARLVRKHLPHAVVSRCICALALRASIAETGLGKLEPDPRDEAI